MIITLAIVSAFIAIIGITICISGIFFDIFFDNKFVTGGFFTFLISLIIFAVVVGIGTNTNIDYLKENAPAYFSQRGLAQSLLNLILMRFKMRP